MNLPAKAMLIVNPISGTSGKESLVATVSERLSAAGFQVDVRFTAGPGDATALARQAIADNFDAVVVAGGDGTINEAATGLRDSSLPMGIIPSGSGNGLARHLEIPMDPAEATEVIINGHIIEGDYGTVNDQPFFCTFGVGFDAAVSHTFARQRRRGLLSYLRSSFSEFIHYDAETYTVSANGKILTEKALVIACCNASQYGNNAYIAPGASITDGLLDITIIHQGTPIDTAIVGVDLFTGYLNKNTLIHSLRAPSAVIYRKNSGMAHVDGEPAMLSDILEVKCHHKGLRLFAPEATMQFRPIVTPINSAWKNALQTFRRWLHV